MRFDRGKGYYINAFDPDLQEQGNIAVFTGGGDISRRFHWFNGDDRELENMLDNFPRNSHDYDCLRLWLDVKDDPEILKVGICRGAQFFCCMNGGGMHEDILNHAGSGGHSITSFDPVTASTKEFWVTSLHHQLMIPKFGDLLGYATDLAQFPFKSLLKGIKPGVDPEVLWWNKTQSFGVQYHPEFMQQQDTGYIYFNNMVRHYLKQLAA